jgi:hypothetical protein
MPSSPCNRLLVCPVEATTTREVGQLTRMLFHCTHGRDDPKRGIVPFIAANVAAASHTEPAPVPG